MRFCCLVWLWTEIGACQIQPNVPRMRIQTSDMTLSTCQKDCLKQRSLCANERRGNQPAKKVTRQEWNQIYHQAQNRADRCDKEYHTCEARCTESNTFR